MIICRTPARISLGGGGTDLPSYYSKFGGFLIAGAINKYIYICATRRFSQEIRLSYSRTEIVEKVSQIQHPIFKECLLMSGIEKQIELVSVADVPSNCGLGTSSTFAVSVLHTLHAYKRESISKHQLAEEACRLEIERLGEPIGKQDQYIASFGGITAFKFREDGFVEVEPLRMRDRDIDELNYNTMLFYTGLQRSSSEILRHQNDLTGQKDSNTVERLHRIKEIGVESQKALESGDLNRFGELLHEHWMAKRGLNPNISFQLVEEAYEESRRLGALGGKLIGAGAGGFLMIYSSRNRSDVIRALTQLGLEPMRYHFDFYGSTIVVNYRTDYE